MSEGLYINTSKYPDDTAFLVTSHQCSECLFTEDRIVDPSRPKEIVQECLLSASHFVCHKGSIAAHNDPALHAEMANLCCRGFYDRFGGGAAGELARSVGIPIVEVDPDSLQKLRRIDEE